MRSVLVATLLVLGLAGSGVAAPAGTLPYHLAVSGTVYAGTTPSGTMNGTLGGLPATGAYANGTWSLTAFRRPFASGTYQCVRACLFSGRSLAGRAIAFTLSSPVPTADQRTVTANGRLWVSGMRQKNTWVATVSEWAQHHRLSRPERSQAIADAGHI